MTWIYRMAGLAAVYIVAAAARAGADPSGHDVLMRAKAAMLHAKTYQATIYVVTSNGPIGAITLRSEFKTVGWKKMWMRSSLTSVGGQPTPPAFTAMAQNTEIIYDGKTAYFYAPALQQYAAIADKSQPDLIGLTSRIDLAERVGTAELVGTQALGGKPAYVVVVRIRSQPPYLVNASTTFYVDKASGQLVEMRSSAEPRSRHGGAGKPESTVVSITNIQLDRPIPNSVFAFKPPADAKRVDRIGAGMGMGVPGRASLRGPARAH